MGRSIAPKSRRSRAVLPSSRAPKPPKVAEKQRLATRSKIEKGIALLDEITTPSQASQAVSDGFPTSVTSFIKWIGIGRSRLYETHSDLRPSVEVCVGSVKKLLLSYKNKKGRKNITNVAKEKDNTYNMSEKIRELEALIEILSADILCLGRDYDELKANYFHAVARYEEVSGSTLPRRVGVRDGQAAASPSADREAVLVQIEDHREMRRRDRGRLQDSHEG